MRSMQQRLGNLGTVSAFACRHRETKKNRCRGGRSQDLPDTDFQPAVRHLRSRRNPWTLAMKHRRFPLYLTVIFLQATLSGAFIKRVFLFYFLLSEQQYTRPLQLHCQKSKNKNLYSLLAPSAFKPTSPKSLSLPKVITTNINVKKKWLHNCRKYWG